MKFPFVSRSLFDEMLRDKNLQISGLQEKIAGLENDRELLWRTQDRHNEILRELHFELGERKTQCCRLEYELGYVLDSLPESVFNQIWPPVPTPNTNKIKAPGSSCGTAGQAPNCNARVAQSPSAVSSGIRPPEPKSAAVQTDRGCLNRHSESSAVREVENPNPSADAPRIRIGRPRARNIVQKMDRQANKRCQRKLHPHEIC